jgi:hypothetical protein
MPPPFGSACRHKNTPRKTMLARKRREPAPSDEADDGLVIAA